MEDSNSGSQSALVLLAEDDENDVFFLRRAFQEARLPIIVIDVPNGEEAINYLSRTQHHDRDQYPLPALLLLDLKMPRVNGFELLEWLQAQLDLRTLPAVVLSSSGFDTDIRRALQLGARGYLVKPQTPEHLLHLVREINSRWLHETTMAC